MLRSLQTPACHPKHSQPYPHCTPRRFACPGHCFHLVKEKRKKRTSAFSHRFLTLRAQPGCSGTVLAPGPQRRHRGAPCMMTPKYRAAFCSVFQQNVRKTLTNLLQSVTTKYSAGPPPADTKLSIYSHTDPSSEGLSARRGPRAGCNRRQRNYFYTSFNKSRICPQIIPASCWCHVYTFAMVK